MQLRFFTSIAIASTFSLYSTAIIGRLIGLEPMFNHIDTTKVYYCGAGFKHSIFL
uniref:Uncharacterized protein n=1 Tax=Arundo donax TaxID=35708 RepID=A0A0A9G9R1_ARUDO